MLTRWAPTGGYAEHRGTLPAAVVLWPQSFGDRGQRQIAGLLAMQHSGNAATSTPADGTDRSASQSIMPGSRSKRPTRLTDLIAIRGSMGRAAAGAACGSGPIRYSYFVLIPLSWWPCPGGHCQLNQPWSRLD